MVAVKNHNAIVALAGFSKFFQEIACTVTATIISGANHWNVVFYPTVSRAEKHRGRDVAGLVSKIFYDFCETGFIIEAFQFDNPIFRQIDKRGKVIALKWDRFDRCSFTRAEEEKLTCFFRNPLD